MVMRSAEKRMSEIVAARGVFNRARIKVACRFVRYCFQRFLRYSLICSPLPRPNVAFAEVITLLNSLAAWAASDGARHPFGMSPVACLPLAQGAGYRE